MMSTDTRLTLAAALARAAALFPNRPAILDREGDLTWSQYVNRIARAASVLYGLGLRPGDRFGIISHNSFRHAELI
ncbi:MAG TPA: AMP-binding protein [Burkholderiales bacterium]|nr:AMP-binding protein [Burkholderiales bacterium]